MAHRSIDDALAEVRSMLHDEEAANYRYSDTDIARALNSAMDELYTARPDAFISLYSTGTPHYVDTDFGSSADFPVDPMFFYPVVMFMVGWLELREEEYAEDGRAAAFLSAAKATFRGS